METMKIPIGRALNEMNCKAGGQMKLASVGSISVYKHHDWGLHHSSSDMGTRLLAGSLAVLLLATSFCCSNSEPRPETSVFVSGKSECIDCEAKNVNTELAYQGLQVAIKCKTGSEGDYEIKSSGELDRNGEYNVQLPAELIGADGEMKKECFAQLHSVSNAPCPDNNGLNPFKLALKSKKEGVHAFSTAAKLPFSSATCASAFFWHPFYKPLPKFPPLPKYCPPKPSSPPTYKPPAPTYKPPTPVPKPPAPVKKPCPPPVPVVKPLPPPVPIKKPCPPVTIPKFPPIHKKPLPPLPKFPPIYHKTLPHLPKFPPIFYHKPMPKFPPIYKKPYHDIPKYPPTHA